MKSALQALHESTHLICPGKCMCLRHACRDKFARTTHLSGQIVVSRSTPRLACCSKLEISWNVPRKIRNVVDTVKGRQLPKQVLSEELLADAYRKYVIAPAIASEHPSKIESMAPLCEVPEALVILLFLSQQYLFLVI
jgi:hypothetical protein